MRDVVRQLLNDWNRERPDLDASAMGIVGRIIVLAKQLEGRANTVLKEFDLPYWGLDVLATLRRGGPACQLSPSELHNAALISSGAMTNRLDRLEDRGMIRRNPDPNDRRRTLVALTPAGRALVERAIAARFDEASDAVAGLTRAERKRLSDLLSKVTKKLDVPVRLAQREPTK